MRFSKKKMVWTVRIVCYTLLHSVGRCNIFVCYVTLLRFERLILGNFGILKFAIIGAGTKKKCLMKLARIHTHTHTPLHIYIYTGWSKILCAPDDYNTVSYKWCSKCPPPLSRHLLTRRTVFSKTMFSIARSTFRMYSVMAIFSSSTVWRLFCTVVVRCTETFWSPCIYIYIYIYI